jgi:hypothetical protein
MAPEANGGRWRESVEGSRFVVALVIIVASFGAIGLSLAMAGALGSSVVTGAWTAISGVSGFYFGGQGIAAAQRAALQAQTKNAPLEDFGERAARALRDAKWKTAMYDRLVEASKKDATLDAMLKRLRVEAQEDDDLER